MYGKLSGLLRSYHNYILFVLPSLLHAFIHFLLEPLVSNDMVGIRTLYIICINVYYPGLKNWLFQRRKLTICSMPEVSHVFTPYFDI